MPWMMPMREYTRAYTSFLASLCSQAGLQAPSPQAVLVSPSISLVLSLWLTTLIHGDNLIPSHFRHQSLNSAMKLKWEIL